MLGLDPPLCSVYQYHIFTFNRSRVSQLVTLHVDSKPISVLCHMGDFGCGDGGWTPVMKTDGNKVQSNLMGQPWAASELKYRNDEFYFVIEISITVPARVILFLLYL